MKNRKLYFESVTGVGNLYLDYIFVSFENEPILFTCISDSDNLYLCLCSELRQEQKWLISRCTIETLHALMKEKIDVKTALCEQEQIVMVVLDLQGEESNSVIKTTEVDDLDLPQDGIFLWKNEEANNNYLCL